MEFVVSFSIRLWLCVLLIALVSETEGRKQRLPQWKTESIADATPDFPQRIRLLDNTRGHIISIYNSKTWLYVCGNNWDIRDATVACRQLGFRRALSATSTPRRTGPAYGIITGEVQCTGTESHLQECPTSLFCPVPSIAIVECEESPGCSKGWISRHGKCYRHFPAFSVRSIGRAASKCAVENASLVSVLSREENHFLSDLVTKLAPDIHHWHTGGSLENGNWVWHKPAEERHSATRIQNNTVKVPITESLWFPGWPAHRYQYAEPTNRVKKVCLTLSNQFRHPDGNMRNLDYFFWKASWCRKWLGINFICQKDIKEEPNEGLDCYAGDGSAYRGKASTTNHGEPCLSWNDSLYINATTHPLKGLGDHNFCRNPDGDTRPWCWIEHAQYLRRYDYCKLPRCPENTHPHGIKATITSPVRATTVPNAFSTTETSSTEALITELNNTPAHLTVSDPISTPDSADFSTPISTLNSASFSQPDSTLISKQDSKPANVPEITPPRIPDSTPHSVQDSTLSIVPDSISPSVPDSTPHSVQDSTPPRVPDSTPVSTPHVSSTIRRGTSPDILTTTPISTSEASAMERNSDPDASNTEQAEISETLTTVRTIPRDTTASRHSSSLETPTTAETTSNSINFTLALVNGEDPWEGRVEITIGGVSGTVCDDLWNDRAATVVCRSLGLNYGGIAFTSAEFGRGSGLIWLDDVQCTGQERRLDQCKHSGWNNHDCDHWEDASVYCFKTSQRNRTGFVSTANTPTTTTSTSASTTTTTTTPATTEAVVLETTTMTLPSRIHPSMLKLVGGPTQHQGNVELIISNISYRICDDDWGEMEASVVCRMLGYSLGGQATKRSRFGQGDYPIILDDVDCSGQEQSLDECSKKFGTEEHNCDSSEFAGVVCRSTDTNQHVCGQRPFDKLNVARLKKDIEVSPNRHRRMHELSRLLSNQGIPRPYSTFQRPRKARMAPIEPKITGGITVPYGKYPWQVSFRRVTSHSTNGRYSSTLFCGGTIISEHWLLTAAHCLQKEIIRNVRIAVGDHDVYGVDKFEQVFEIEETISHENFSPQTLDYDIALVKVKSHEGRGIIFNNFVQPACLPSASTPYRSGAMCDISGWGRTEAGNFDSKPRILQAASIPLVTWHWCRIAFLFRHFSDRMMCAGFLRGGKDTCKGDSGGPLVCKDIDAYTLFGITSWGTGSCGQNMSPGVYAYVVKFLPWIHEKIRTHSQSVDERTIPRRP